MAAPTPVASGTTRSWRRRWCALRSPPRHARACHLRQPVILPGGGSFRSRHRFRRCSIHRRSRRPLRGGVVNLRVNARPPHSRSFRATLSAASSNQVLNHRPVASGSPPGSATIIAVMMVPIVVAGWRRGRRGRRRSEERGRRRRWWEEGLSASRGHADDQYDSGK